MDTISRKGFTLFETLIAAIVLAIIGSGVLGIYAVENGLLTRMSHRVQAINYAASVAEILEDKGKRSMYFYEDPSAVSIGVHSDGSDPEICVLPDSYFKQRLNGTLSYVVDEITVDIFRGRRVEIIVEWDEYFPKKQHLKESMFIVPFYDQWWWWWW